MSDDRSNAEPRVRVQRPTTEAITIDAIGSVKVAIGDLKASIVGLDGRITEMASLQREHNEDLERGFGEVKASIVKLEGRVEAVDRFSERGFTETDNAIKALATSMEASLLSFTSQVEDANRQNAKHRDLFMQLINEDRAHQRAREDREHKREEAERAAELERERAERDAAQEAKARKDQWLTRLWERSKQPMMMIMMAAAGALIALFGRC